MKKEKKGIIYLPLYVDDLCVFGDRADIEELIKAIQKKFMIKIEGKLDDFLGCEILRDGEKQEC